MDGKPTVLVLEPVDPTGIALMENAGLRVDQAEGLAAARAMSLLPAANALVIRSATRVDRAVLDEMPALRAVGRAGVGVDNVDLAEATQRGIAVLNTPGGNAVAAAEHTMALLLALARHVAAAHATVAAGGWDRHRFVGRELAGKTLGLVGLGRVGTLVAERARAFDMTVVVHDPYVTAERTAGLGVEKLDLEPLLERADVVSLHLPLTEETRHRIDAAALRRMKPGALLINCARGGLVDEDAVAAALRDGTLAGAALDVFEREPPAGSPLLGLTHVVHTPHLGASTYEAKENVSRTLGQALVALLRDGDYSSAINLPFGGADLRELGPLLDLARRLGRFQGGLLEGAPARVELDVAAEDVLEPAPLAQAFLCGLLETVVGEEVNAVNAQLKADALGIVVSQGRRPPEGRFPRLLCTRVSQGERSRAVDGGMLARDTPRIVRVDGMWMDVEPVGDLLVLWNADVPGVIGKVATLLGARRINIGEMRLGRRAGSREAISVWQVDSAVDAATRTEIQRIEEIESVRQVRLGAAPLRRRS
jgi:D-3-phosphoglycerate dehydrogenase